MRSGFLRFGWSGEGVVGLGLLPGLGLGLGFAFRRVSRVSFRVGDGTEEADVDEGLEKKEVIWLCLFTRGDRPLDCRRAGAISWGDSIGLRAEGNCL